MAIILFCTLFSYWPTWLSLLGLVYVGWLWVGAYVYSKLLQFFNTPPKLAS